MGGTVHSSSLSESRGCLGRTKVGKFDIKLEFSNVDILVWEAGSVHSSTLSESKGCLGRSKVGSFDLKLDFSNVKFLLWGGVLSILAASRNQEGGFVGVWCECLI